MTHHSSTKTWEICTQQPETDFSLAATHLLWNLLCHFSCKQLREARKMIKEKCYAARYKCSSLYQH
jgi:hypothetical protein